MHDRPTLLYFFRGENPDVRPSFAAPLEAQGWRVDSVAVSDFARARGILEILRSRRDFAAYDVFAASEYFLTWALCLRLLFRGPKPKLIAIGFNQSSTRLARTGFRPVDWLLNRVWRRVSCFIVHSRAEARLFAGLHDIPAKRFVFSHWGYDLPRYKPRPVADVTAPYVTMVGRNNRDLATFSEAVRRAGVRGVLITAAYMLDRYPLEPQEDVVVLLDRPIEECLNYVAGSVAHLVLVTDAERGAGHISAVSAMLLGKPQVFSDVAPLADYLVDDLNGIAVPVGDSEAAAAAIKKLLSDQELAERLGEAGRRFALETMSDSASSARVAQTIVAVFGSSVDP